MERPEDFEDRRESDPETVGETAASTGGETAATTDEERNRDGRFAGNDSPQQTSDTEERRSDG